MTQGPETRSRATRAWVKFADNRWVRFGITAAVGTALFVLGVAYLNLGREPDVATLMVTGGRSARAGAPAAVRVGARMADSRDAVPVTVAPGEALGPVVKSVDGEAPAIVRFEVPADASGQLGLVLDVTAGGRQERLTVNLPVTRGETRIGLPDLEPGLSEISLNHRVEVLPEAGELAANMANQVFLRVLDKTEGRPVSGARVTVTHPALDDGVARCTTDAGGLCRFFLVAKQPSFRLVVRVEDAGGVTTQTDALLRPRGRRLLLRAPAAVFTTDAPVVAQLESWESDARVYCDLIGAGAWIDSRMVQVAHGDAAIDLGMRPPGRYKLQCYPHDSGPGETFATLPVVVEDGDPLEISLRVAREEGIVHSAAAVAPPGSDRALALAYWQASLREGPSQPEVLLTTRAGDLESRTATHEARKQRLLLSISGVFLLVLLWVGEMIIRNVLVTRQSLRRYAAEMMEDGELFDIDELATTAGQQRARLLRTRGLLVLVVVGGAIIANVVGLLALFSMIR